MTEDAFSPGEHGGDACGVFDVQDPHGHPLIARPAEFALWERSVSDMTVLAFTCPTFVANNLSS
jgi:hypothetical protein